MTFGFVVGVLWANVYWEDEYIRQIRDELGIPVPNTHTVTEAAVVTTVSDSVNEPIRSS